MLPFQVLRPLPGRFYFIGHVFGNPHRVHQIKTGHLQCSDEALAIISMRAYLLKFSVPEMSSVMPPVCTDSRMQIRVHFGTFPLSDTIRIASSEISSLRSSLASLLPFWSHPFSGDNSHRKGHHV